MTEKDVVLEMTQALDQAGIAYMVVGSLSSNAYGIPRATQDADMVIDAGAQSVAELADQLPAELRLDPQVTFESVTGTHRFVVKRQRSHYKVELFLLSDDPHDRERFGRRKRGEAFGHPVWLPTPEDVILSKLRWSLHGKRPKDIQDVKGILLVQQSRLDFEYLHNWCDVHGTRSLLDEIRAELPSDS